MRYLYEQGILHRDLKPQNILMDSNFYPRICDFGFSRCFSEALTQSIQLSMTGQIGAPLYMAPELYDEDEKHFGPGIDVYAFAIIAYEIMTGKEPFTENGKPISIMKLSRKLMNGERPKFTENSGVSKKMRDLIERCWCEDPMKRPPFSEIFKELAGDLSYFDEDIDEDEVNNYIEELNESKKNEVKMKEKEEHENEVKRLSELFIDPRKIKMEEDIGERPFGRGATGITYKGSIHRNYNEQEMTVAIKVRPINIITDGNIQSLFVGFEAQSSLKHIAILPLIGFSTPTEDSKMYREITPFMPNSSLDKLITNVYKGNAPSDWELIRSIIIFGTAAGIACIHQHGFIHRDFKPGNIWLDEQYHPKIGDFSISCICQKGGMMYNGDSNGSPLYMAPEICQNDSYNHKIDVFSYSIILYQLLVSNTPYDIRHVTAFKLMKSVIDGIRPKIPSGKISDAWKELMRQCWDPDHHNRPSSIEIVKSFLSNKKSFFGNCCSNRKFNDYVNEAIKGLDL